MVTEVNFDKDDRSIAEGIYQDMLDSKLGIVEERLMYDKLAENFEMLWLVYSNAEFRNRYGQYGYDFSIPKFVKDGWLESVGHDSYRVTAEGWSKIGILSNPEARRFLIEYDVSLEPISNSVTDTTNQHLKAKFNLYE